MRCQIYQDPAMDRHPGRRRRRSARKWPRRRCAELATPPPAIPRPATPQPTPPPRAPARPETSPPEKPATVRPPTTGEARHDQGKQGRVSLTIGVDIGGTKVLGGIVGREGEVLAQARRPTPADDPPR